MKFEPAMLDDVVTVLPSLHTQHRTNLIPLVHKGSYHSSVDHHCPPVVMFQIMYLDMLAVQPPQHYIKQANILHHRVSKIKLTKIAPKRKFVKEDVVAYAKSHGIGDYAMAYRELHFNAIVQVEAKKTGGTNPPGSEPPTGGEKGQPGGGGFTTEQINAMSPEEYEKNRPAIMAAIKPKGTMTV